MSPLDALRPSPLVDQAAQRLREEIMAGTWPIGTKLPGETTLARTLSVGRSTVREALRVLAGAGLVQARQGAGVFVLATAPTEEWAAGLRQAAIGDLYEVRALVEVGAGRLAAERRSSEDVITLRQALTRRREAAAQNDAAFVDADISLHAAVVAAAHNPVLSALFAEFVPLLRSGLIDLLKLVPLRADRPAHGEEAHTALVDSIERGDAEAAGTILAQELKDTLGHLRSLAAS
jgi:DNA-binding FadR family transcriptional regulator